MTQSDRKVQPGDLRLRRLILAQAAEINGKLLARLAMVADDLDQGCPLAALGGLDGLERQIETMRSFLLLLRHE